jgi:hypothetical protein
MSLFYPRTKPVPQSISRAKEKRLGNGALAEEDNTVEDEIILEEKIKLLEAKLNFSEQVINAQKAELELLRKNSNQHTTFLHDTIAQLITKSNEKPAVSPAVAAYLAKKDSDATKSVKELAKPSEAGK